MATEIIDNIEKEIIQQSVTITDHAVGVRTVLKDQQAVDIAVKHNVSMYIIYETALKKGILPYRYIRNLESISVFEQLKLHESRVSVIGSGGLGGQVVILLARLGIGNMVVIDHDVFDETNLNRQALCDIDVIGKSKSETAQKVVNKINPAINITAFQYCLDNSNAETALAGSEVIVDALDNVPDRFILEGISKKLHIPLIHGAVAGFEGQIMTIFPDDEGIEKIYSKKSASTGPEKNPVAIFGVPAVTPAVIASYQSMEVLKILLKKEMLLRKMLVYMNLAKCESKKLHF